MKAWVLFLMGKGSWLTESEMVLGIYTTYRSFIFLCSRHKVGLHFPSPCMLSLAKWFTLPSDMKLEAPLGTSGRILKSGELVQDWPCSHFPSSIIIGCISGRSCSQSLVTGERTTWLSTWWAMYAAWARNKLLLFYNTDLGLVLITAKYNPFFLI